PLGQFRSTQRVLSGLCSRIIARAARRRLFHPHSDRSNVAHNARIDVSCFTAEPARASGGGVERVAGPATRRALIAREPYAFSAAPERLSCGGLPAVCCTCSRRLLAQTGGFASRSATVAFAAKRTCRPCRERADPAPLCWSRATGPGKRSFRQPVRRPCVVRGGGGMLTRG